MTKQSKSGTENKEIEQVKKSIKRGDVTTRKAEAIDQDNNNWEVQQIETKSDPLVDDQTGKETIIRQFEFMLPPSLPKGMEFPSKDQLLKFHRSKVIAFLWKDELELIDEPRIEISKKADKFRIFAVCQAKKGSLILQKPLSLQQVTSNART